MKKRSKKNSRKLSRILRPILLILMSLLLGINVYSWNANNLVGNKLPMPFGCGMAVVLSGSMEPSLSVDDLIFVKECDQYQVDDIVVFQSGSELIVHRVIEIDGTTLITKGDANNVADSPVDVELVKGKLIGRIPFAGMIISWLKTPLGVVVVLGAAFLLLEVSYRKEKNQDIDELEKIKDEIRRLREE